MIKPLLKNKKLLALVIAGILGLGGITLSQSEVRSFLDIVIPEESSAQAKTTPDTGTIPPTRRVNIISAGRRAHILYGDETGGGHAHGAGRPCKSEFPADWDEDKIINTIATIAANDNIPWRAETNGYYVGEQKVGDLQVRVVLDQEKDDVVTGYPLNVARNPCPTATDAANDNEDSAE